MLKSGIAIAAAVLLSGCIIIDADTDYIGPRLESCTKGNFNSLLGMQASQIDRDTLPSSFRIVCSGCPMTMDYSADRLTIQLDSANRVESVKCG